MSSKAEIVFLHWEISLFGGLQLVLDSNLALRLDKPDSSLRPFEVFDSPTLSYEFRILFA